MLLQVDVDSDGDFDVLVDVDGEYEYEEQVKQSSGCFLTHPGLVGTLAFFHFGTEQG